MRVPSRQFRKSNCNQWLWTLGSEHYRTLVTPNRKEAIKKSTASFNIQVVRRRKIIIRKRHNHWLMVDYLNGPVQSGLSNGKKLFSFRTLRLAFHTPITKLWLTETNLLKRMELFQAIKSSTLMRISWQPISRDSRSKVFSLRCLRS